MKMAMDFQCIFYTCTIDLVLLAIVAIMFSVEGDAGNVEGDDGNVEGDGGNDVHRGHGYASPEAAPKTCHPLQLKSICMDQQDLFLSRCRQIFQVAARLFM